MGTVAFRASENRNVEEGAAANQLFGAEKTVQEEAVEESSHHPGWGIDDPNTESSPFNGKEAGE